MKEQKTNVMRLLEQKKVKYTPMNIPTATRPWMG